MDEHVYQTGNYVWPLYGDDGDASCVECDTGASGVVYEIAGATYESIHLGQGYFRHSNDDLCLTTTSVRMATTVHVSMYFSKPMMQAVFELSSTEVFICINEIFSFESGIWKPPSVWDTYT